MALNLKPGQSVRVKISKHVSRASAVKTLERLEGLHLNRTGITDKGLTELKGLEGLRALSVGGTKVTALAADKFPDEMPNLRVVRR